MDGRGRTLGLLLTGVLLVVGFVGFVTVGPAGAKTSKKGGTAQ